MRAHSHESLHHLAFWHSHRTWRSQQRLIPSSRSTRVFSSVSVCVSWANITSSLRTLKILSTLSHVESSYRRQSCTFPLHQLRIIYGNALKRQLLYVIHAKRGHLCVFARLNEHKSHILSLSLSFSRARYSHIQLALIDRISLESKR